MESLSCVQPMHCNAMHADPHPTYHKGTKATTLSEYIWYYCGLGARRRVGQGLSQAGAELIDTVQWLEQ